MFRSRAITVMFNTIAFCGIITSTVIVVSLLLKWFDTAIYGGAALGCLVSLMALIGCIAKKK